MSILLYESFENKKHLNALKKKIRLIKINVNSKYRKDKVKFIYIKFFKYLSKNFLKKFVNLEYIFSPTTGINHIDKNYCLKNNIKIIYLNDTEKIKNISSTTELALTLLLSAIRRLGFYFRNHKYELAHRYTVGIIGFGRIGSTLFKLLNVLDFDVFFFDKKKKFTKHKKYLPLTKLLIRSDIISLHLNFNEKNSNFFDNSKFKLCKKNLCLINTSRGEIVDEKSLISFLKKNKKASAYLDVIKNEQTKKTNNPILKYNNLKKNLFLTPHIGGAASDALLYTEEIVIKELYKILRIKI